MTRRGERTRKSGPGFTRYLLARDGRLARLFAALGFLLALGAFWYVWPYWRLSGEFAALPTACPSRLFGAPLRLAAGGAFSAETLPRRLAERGYREVDEGELVPGTWRRSGGHLAVFRRHFPSPESDHGGNLLEVELAGDRVQSLALGGRPVREALLDPPLLATFYDADLLELRPTPLSEVATEAVRAVLAAEDASFFEHPGISLPGILRALWVNLRGGEVAQGGSTLTQQLAKNLYLTAERTVSRKLREAMLALMLEWRYSKEEILEAYLNRIFWGRSGSANLIGIGAAAAAYCGKEPGELSLAEGALLAAIIRSPTHLNPVRDAEAARARRDQVLDRLAALRWATPEAVAAAKAEPLPTEQPPLTRRLAPYFVDAAAAEAKRRFGVGELAGSGLTLLATLDLDAQEAAEAAVAKGLDELSERLAPGRRKGSPLQAALVSLAPASGAVTAWVGGRDYRESQFDRAGAARRQAGSAFKPIVYATAFERGRATPATLLEDAPLSLTSGGREWTPQNDDDQFHGWVTARTAVEKSYNVPTVRLALATGLSEVVATARALGVEARLEAVPAIALGAFEVSPLELATAFSTFANRGTRAEPRLLAAVLGRDGAPLAPATAAPPEAVLSPRTAFLVTTILQGVIDYGTGRRVRDLGLADPVAGKTGTSNGARDNWFVGYSPERATAVWVGYDDDRPTPFSGAKAALPIWARFMLAVRPAGGYGRFAMPPGIRVVLIDPASGELATERCPEVLSEAFPEESAPRELCHLHARWSSAPLDPQARADREANPERGIAAWLKRLFNRRQRGPEPPG